MNIQNKNLDTFVFPEHKRFTLIKFGWLEEKTLGALRKTVTGDMLLLTGGWHQTTS